VNYIELAQRSLEMDPNDELEPFEKAYLAASESDRLRYKIAMPAEEEYTKNFAFMGDDVIKRDDRAPGTLVSWVGVAGSRVGDSVAPSFTLPDGRILRLFHSSQRRNARTPAAEPAENVPETLAGLGMHRLPQRPQPPHPNERDVPRIARTVELHAPVPVKTVLEQTNPPPSFGEITTEPFTIRIHERARPAHEEEAAPAAAQEQPFTLERSSFSNRRKTSDGHSFYTRKAITARAFHIDWSRCNTPTFRKLISKEDDGGYLEAEVELTEIRDVLFEHHQVLFTAYTYYCAIRDEADGYAMGLPAFFSFLRHCRLVDPDSKYCSPSALESIFRAADVEDKATNTLEQRELNRLNHSSALMRFEFLQCIVRVAIARYVRDKDAVDHKKDVSDAVTELLTVNIIPNLPNEASHDFDLFRRKRLYTRAVDGVFAKYHTALSTIFNYYASVEGQEMSLKPLAPTLSFYEFFTLLSDCGLLYEEGMDPAKHPVTVSPLQARLILMWSQMFVSDELKRRHEFVSANYTDFLEMLGRMCTFMDLPTKELLDKYGAKSAKEFYDKQNTGEHDGVVLGKSKSIMGDDEDVAKMGFYWKTEESSEVPLEGSLEMLIILMLDRLDESGDGQVDRMDLLMRRARITAQQKDMLRLRGTVLQSPDE